MVKILMVALGVAVAGVLMGFYIVGFLLNRPAIVPTATQASHTGSVTLQVIPAYGHDPFPDWVTYYVQDPNGNWVHSTYFTVPAYSTVTVTIYQFDSASGFRTPLFGQVRGTIGGTMQLDGHTVNAIDPTTAGHSFAVPDLGLSVPLHGIADNAKNVCSQGPCDPSQFDHTTIAFSFKTGAPGSYRWQCFVPCAAGFFQGWGGPMQSIGYMDGEMIVQ